MQEELDPEGRFYASGMRHKLMYGADRQLAWILFGLCALLAYIWMTVLGLASAVLLWFLAMKFLRQAAKQDPLLVRVYLRRLAYQSFYSAKTKLGAKLPRVPMKWVR